MEQIHKLCEFLYAVKGSWRNAAYIDCEKCSCDIVSAGVLLTTNHTGRPLLIPVKAFQDMAGTTIDKSECQSELTHHAFESLYSLWLEWTVNSARECALRQAVCKAGWEMPCNM